jgi:hypothetical protein
LDERWGKASSFYFVRYEQNKKSLTVRLAFQSLWLTVLYNESGDWRRAFGQTACGAGRKRQRAFRSIGRAVSSFLSELKIVNYLYETLCIENLRHLRYALLYIVILSSYLFSFLILSQIDLHSYLRFYCLDYDPFQELFYSTLERCLSRRT